MAGGMICEEVRKIKKFTDEQLERASNIDIVKMLQAEGEKLKKQGKVYRWLRYDSTVIYRNKWYRHSRQVGGGPIQFMQHFYGMGFVDAVKHLLCGEEGMELVEPENEEEDVKEFTMPDMSKNMHRAFAYLIKTRKIDAEIVQFFVKEGKIAETEEYHNVAFCGFDETGTMRQMHLRSTNSKERFFMDVEGSDKKYYFRHNGIDNEVYVFEAPIDMLSYITIHKENWQDHSYVCLGGVAIDALKNVLETNSNITKVHLCLDNDKAGNLTVDRIVEGLDECGVEWDRLVPENKDWNEDLTKMNCQEECIGFSMSM